MAIEKKWTLVPPQTITSNGTSDGHITIADTTLFKVKQQILIGSNTVQAFALEVKRINTLTDMELGPKGNIDDRANLTNILTSDSPFIKADIQPRPTISWEDIRRAIFEEEPTVALRTLLVDKLGNKYGLDNPLPVQLSDGSISIGTVNANVEVQLSAKDNDPHPGDVHDSIRIGDGTNEAEINPDGSFNVSIVPSATQNAYGEVTGVLPSDPTNIVTYVAPADKTSYLQKAFVSGENIAQYKVKLNGTTIDTKRTYFGELNEDFDFSDTARGRLLSPGDTIVIEVTHFRPDPSDFNGRIQTIEV